ncbi:MAG: rubrerythrin [Betaproteobacteria bacterium]|nr:MAG: rubrerythrin [Betaproteobacteria bacterium]
MSIESAAELYVHAIAIEREAAERYREFAERMADQGNEELARVFGKLAAFESDHLKALRRRTSGVALPPLAADYSWLDAGTPQTAAHDLIFRLLTPRQALAIALQAEKRARAFFSHVQRDSGDPALRALAKEMAAEETEHMQLLERTLERARDPFVDWASVFEGSDRAQH